MASSISRANAESNGMFPVARYQPACTNIAVRIEPIAVFTLSRQTKTASPVLSHARNVSRGQMAMMVGTASLLNVILFDSCGP